MSSLTKSIFGFQKHVIPSNFRFHVLQLCVSLIYMKVMQSELLFWLFVLIFLGHVLSVPNGGKDCVFARNEDFEF